jgi:hypothetical protein
VPLQIAPDFFSFSYSLVTEIFHPNPALPLKGEEDIDKEIRGRIAIRPYKMNPISTKRNTQYTILVRSFAD